MPSKWSPGCNCCDGAACDCDNLNGPPTICQCIENDFDDEGDWVTDSGTIQFTFNHSATIAGSLGFLCPGSCPDPSGTYSASCSSGIEIQRYAIASVCNPAPSPSDSYFIYYIVITFQFTTTGYSVSFNLESGRTPNTLTSNPYPTLTSVSSRPSEFDGPGQTCVFTANLTSQADYYLYNTATCDPTACTNPTQSHRKCTTGTMTNSPASCSLPLDPFGDPAPPDFYCDTSASTFSAAVV